jgi:hypothetical protein
MEPPNDIADAKSTPPSIMPHHITATNAPALESSALSSPLQPSPIGPPNANDDVVEDVDDDPALALVDFQHEMGTLNLPAATDEDTLDLPLTLLHNLGGDDVAEPPPKCDDGAEQVIDPSIMVTNANADGVVPSPSSTSPDGGLPSSSSAIQDDQKISAREYLTALKVSL